jgi:hypothetical protein
MTRRPRAAMRSASPASLQQLRSAGAQVVATDDSVQARLVALEQQARQDHAYKLEIVQAVQSPQALANTGQPRLEFVGQRALELEQHRAQHLEMRRELLSVRDQLTEKVNYVAQQTEIHLKGGFIDIIETKFEVLEAAIKSMHGHLEEQHLVEKPNGEHLANNAFT